ncbi:hypothetical protein CTAM01_01947 [Colletotrichum tamarilloi]|uniref:Uncharacterized protein n=1 Tax=Colletotrichum tamarilloi TaxID=1209934 RepID=A0ABQ9RPY2_9PEZI|nr:uncharacterized protein CTAM01_01947 [Colletotrichum tamarilloi]KAI3541833.1 hypothetical protein CSPX01_07341 [Colletotrichum filicis]KAK1509824.1 hypothetical protein CTAM01_01947 [Colletotrichum tamarilloi]
MTNTRVDGQTIKPTWSICDARASEFAEAFTLFPSRVGYKINFAYDVDATSSSRDETLDTNFAMQNGWSKYPSNRHSAPGHGCQSDISQMDPKLGIADPLQRYPMPFPTLVLDQTTPNHVSLPRPNKTSQGI